MSRITVAFDYFSPQFPLLNNQDFTLPFSSLEVDNGIYEFFSKLGGYECRPSLTLTEHDYFIYPIRLGFHPDGWLKNPEIDIIATTNMSLHTFNGIRGRNGFLFFDLGSESWLDDSVLDPIHDYCKQKEIPLKKVILQTSNINAEKIYEDYCYRKQLTNGGIQLAPIEYFEWLTSRLNYEHRSAKNQVLPLNTEFSKIKKTFFCLNRVQRWHRVNLYLLFNQFNLIDDTYFTMDKVSHMHTDDANYTENLWRDSIDKSLCERFKINEQYIEQIYNKLPLKIDEYGEPAAMAELYNKTIDPYYHNSLISVVTETNFANNEIFLTEKIFKPILHRHPFILVGAYKTLDHLKTLGYKTFSDFFDESYDDIEDPKERLVKIVEICKDIQGWPDTKRKTFFYKAMAITNHNYELLTSLYPDKMRRNFWHKLRDFVTFDRHKKN